MLRFGLYSLLYLLGALYATALVSAHGEVTLLWPPAGIGFALVLRYGPRWALLPVAPLLVLHLLLAPVPLAFVPFSLASNVLGMLVAWAVCRRWIDGDERMSLRTGFGMLGGGMIMSAVSALIGATGLVVADMTPQTGFWTAFAKWAMGDLLAMVALGPLILYLTLPAGHPLQQGRSAAADASSREKLLWLLATALVWLLIHLAGDNNSAYIYGLVALPVALLLWSAVRFEPLWTIAGTTGAVLLMTAFAGFGIAGFPTPRDHLDAAILLGSMCVYAVIPQMLMAVTTQERAANRRALRRATMDEATGLPNRAAFESTMRDALAHGQRPWSLAYLDLDHLSIVNDTASHAAGDALLHGVASLLRAETAPHGEAFRIGGDEFALLLEGEPAQARADVERIRAAIEHYRVGWHGRVLNATASIGLAHLRGGETRYADALALADTACLTAKEQGGNRVCLAGEGPEALHERTETMRWALRIREALDRGLFELHCQSIAPLAGADPDGLHYEVLLRMRESRGGPALSPAQFIPAAERFHLGVALDRHVVELALGWLESHPDAAARTGLCAINLTAASMVDDGFRAFLGERVRRSPVPARKLCFEITETSAVRDLARAGELIAELHALGCAFALDDFGTGFCSFDYLRSLDVDYLKIDGSFVRNLGDSELSSAVVRSITEVAHVLRKRTIAEHVEDETAWSTLRALGVDHAQGYYLHRPEPMEAYFAAPRSAAA
jgi:diguanylate cyclase (GGDEF)-like protein